MALSYDEASRIAGDLYGRLLQRDSDPDGFAHALDGLTNGTLTARHLVQAICISEEFREKHVMNQTPNELARLILTCLLHERRPAPARIKTLAVRLVEQDWRAVIAEAIACDAYARAYGEDGVPRWA